MVKGQHNTGLAANNAEIFEMYECSKQTLYSENNDRGGSYPILSNASPKLNFS